jgi:hypothetical protein
LILTGIVVGILGVFGVAGLLNTTTSSTTIGLEKLRTKILDLDRESSPPNIKPPPLPPPPQTYCTKDHEKGKLTCDGRGEEKCATLYTNS